MNGFSHHPDLDEVDFSEKKGTSLKTFDAFPKTKPTYLTRTHTGSHWTLILILTSALLIIAETRRWFAGTVNHAFTVEKGVSHSLQINVDMVVPMMCEDLHVNVQDASGDRILAGDLLKKDLTNWSRWVGKKSSSHELGNTIGNGYGQGEEEDVHDYLGAAHKGKKKFKKTPRVKGTADACRIFGNIETNKVQGDFHITARGHGYFEFGMHLDHSKFNFSHVINELSFGPYYPSLVNPLDDTYATTDANFYKFQYYTSIVPTIYTTDIHRMNTLSPNHHSEPLTNLDTKKGSSNTVFTNQYAVTSQSHPVSEMNIPGVFFKYDIEPLLLVVNEERGGIIALFVRLVNVVSGVLVSGTWLLQLTDYIYENYSKGQGRGQRLGFLGAGRHSEKFV